MAERIVAVLPPARIIGRICAARHPRLAYYEATCPLCAAGDLLERARIAVDGLNARVKELEAR